MPFKEDTRPPRDEIARRIWELRQQRDWSQEELAAALGNARTNVNKWERARARPSARYAAALAELSPDGTEPSDFRPKPEERPLLEERVDQLVRVTERLTESVVALQARLGAAERRLDGD